LRSRRFLTLGVILIVLGVPALALRALCVGRSCAAADEARTPVPFCSLPDEIRTAISKGFYEGRSGDVLGVTGSGSVMSDGQRWPSARVGPPRVPIVFWGAGIQPGVQIAETPGLEDIAPTIASALDFVRPHPDVRAGTTSIAGVVTETEEIRLVLQIVWEGIGTRELAEAEGLWPNLQRLFDTGAGVRDAEIGSLPTDPAAAITTIGTGGFPYQHGMTSGLVRNDRGRPVRPWGPGTPSSVIATLSDHLEESFGQDPIIGVVGGDVIARGLIGGTWGIQDRDLVRLLPRTSSTAQRSAEVVHLLRTSVLGADEIPDVLGVVMDGDLKGLDRSLPRMIAAAERASDGRLLVVVAGTGSADVDDGAEAMTDTELIESVEDEIPGVGKLIGAATPGALFLDADELRRRDVYDDVVLKPLLELRSRSGSRLFADVFPAAAVTFGRFC
jgi:hypothetical protein